MKFALIENLKAEATKGAIGLCPNCGSKLVAKCGAIKIPHWSHQGIRNCDTWWENETEWHRTWKSNFPEDWQEIILQDNLTGEKHIADVRTIHDLVIEFQHSYIDFQERAKREDFYKKMVWVVDGTRLKRDCARFLKGESNFRQTKERGLFTLYYPEECFHSAWVGSSKHVIFDFKGIQSIEPTDWRNFLYYLFPKTNNREYYVAKLTRQSFIENIITGKWFS